MKINKKICIMILTGIYIFFINIFNVKAEMIGIEPIEYYCPNGTSFKEIHNDKWYYGCNHTNTSYFKTTLKYNFGVNFQPGYYDISGFMYTEEDIVNIYTNVGGTSCFITNEWYIGDSVSGPTFLNFYCFNVYIQNPQNFNIDVEGNGRQQGGRTGVGRELTINPHFDKSQTNNIQNIKDKMNEDISQSDKDAPDQTQYNTAKNQEENIIQSISNVSPNDITFNQDLQATNKIWETTTRFLQTNGKVMGLVISILSIGIIKLIMNR